MELRDYLRVIKDRWILVAACVLVTTGVAATLSFRSPEIFQSQARLFIARVDDSNKKAYEGGLLSIQRMATYTDLASGPELAGRVADDLGLPALNGPINATVVPQSLLLSLTAQDNSPERAQQIANSASEHLIEIIDELEDPPGPEDAPVKTTVVDAASLPTSPISPNLRRNIGLGLVLGLLLGLGLAVMREVLSPAQRSGDRLNPNGRVSADLSDTMRADAEANRREASTH